MRNMKIYKERKLNAMYLLHNLQKVGDLKEGMEIMVSTHDVIYWTSGWVKNIYKEDFPIDNLVPLVKEINMKSNWSDKDVLDNVTRLDNIIGNSVLSFKVINGIKCLILTLSSYMVKNLQEIFQEDEYLVFDNLTLVERNFEDSLEISICKKIVALQGDVIKLHTEEEINSWYEKVADKILDKEESVIKLLDGGEIPGTNGCIWSKTNYETELNLMLEIINLIKDSDNKIKVIEDKFRTLNEVPMKLLNDLLNLKDVNMITRVFS